MRHLTVSGYFFFSFKALLKCELRAGNDWQLQMAPLSCLPSIFVMWPDQSVLTGQQTGSRQRATDRDNGWQPGKWTSVLYTATAHSSHPHLWETSQKKPWKGVCACVLCSFWQNETRSQPAQFRLSVDHQQIPEITCKGCNLGHNLARSTMLLCWVIL